MKLILPISFLLFFLLGEVWAQDNLDFLDKVNDKPKVTTPVKTKEETTSTNTTTTVNTSTKKSIVVNTKSKKKRSKKKNQTITNNTQNLVDPNRTDIISNNTNVIPETKKLTVLPEIIKKEEDISLSGLWIEPEVVIEPDGLPGFGSDVSFGKGASSDESKGSGAVGSQISKPLFSFSEFFDKYKKAMMILGIIVLFAFYRLRMAKPGSSSKSYRR
ncbi:MAG: SRP-less Sec system protein [Leptospira sp.]|nr:SRP-less Sec system protein [Leptospira sp.]